MDIIFGASGQVGSLVVKLLHETGRPIKAVVRKRQAKEDYLNSGIESEIADFNDLSSLNRVLKKGSTLFVLTPENPASNNILSDTRTMLDHIRQAVRHSAVGRIVGLSSFGAQHSSGTGNLLLSNLLEHAFDEMDVETVFVRPAYYFSNWSNYLETVEETGVLPAFFPADLKIPMIAPTDVAGFISELISNPAGRRGAVEIMGPSWYSTNDVAAVFGKILNKEVQVTTIPEDEWENSFLQFGATENYAASLAEMTKAVVDGKTTPSRPDDVIILKTSLEEYLEKK